MSPRLFLRALTASGAQIGGRFVQAQVETVAAAAAGTALQLRRWSHQLTDALLHRALSGDVESIAEVGRQYLDGERSSSSSGDGDDDGGDGEARRWLEAAAELGHVESKFLLGIVLTGKKSATIPVPAPTSSTSSSSSSSAGAESEAAKVLREIKEATKAARAARKERMLRKALKASADGLRETGDAQVEPTPHDVGMDWLRQAARGGSGRAMCYLGNLLLTSATSTADDVFEAVLWYERAASLDAPVPDALFNLGTLYFDGKDGAVAPDLSKSLAYFTRSADLGDASAQFWVGHCHMTGEGGAPWPDPGNALKYLLAAAEQGHTSAMYHLATMYRNGLSSEEVSRSKPPDRGSACSHDHDHAHDHGHCDGTGPKSADTPSTASVPSSSPPSSVPADKQLFFKYLHQAVAAEDPDALYCLADMHMQGLEGLPVDEVKGRELVEQASGRGHVEATVSLGAMHYHGHCGLPKDARRAFELYNAAAELGSKEAWRNLAAMYYTGDGVPKSEETAKEIMRVIFGGKAKS